MKLMWLIISSTLLLHSCVFAGIRFGSEQSVLTLGKDGILNVASDVMYVENGTLNVRKKGLLNGGRVDFDYAHLKTLVASDVAIKGKLVPKRWTEITLAHPEGVDFIGELHLTEVETEENGIEDGFFFSNAGGVICKVIIDYGVVFLRGQPLFHGNRDIELAGSMSFLNLAINNTLNTKVLLNGGFLVLESDLSLGDQSVFEGDGFILLNGRRLFLGGIASRWDGDLFWVSALDLQVNSRIDLNGKWTFFQESQINGNGNVIDLSGGGVLMVLPGSSLRLSGVKIKGLGSGSIIVGKEASLYLSDVEIEMDGDYDFFSGQIYIDGSSTIIAKQHILTFRDARPVDYVLDYVYEDKRNVWDFIQGVTAHGSLLIDRVALTYDPLEYVDQYNIRPLRINDPTHKFIKILNGGSIRKFRMESISFLDYSSDVALQRYAVVFPVRPIKVFPEVIDGHLNYEVRVKGNSNYYRFTEARQPLMFIEDGVHVEYQDLLFSQFSADYLSFGEDASLIFGDNTTVELFRSEDLTYTWTFQGNTYIRGGGSILNLAEQGEIVVAGEQSVLTISNMTIMGLRGHNIRCLQDSSKIVFKDVKLVLDGDYAWERGAIDIVGEVELTGAFTFMYGAVQQYTISAYATCMCTLGITFLYNPYAKHEHHINPQALRDLVYMQHRSSRWFFQEATLSVPAPGMRLMRGTFECSKFNDVYNDGGVDATNGLVFGDGSDIHRVVLDMAHPYALNMKSGVMIEQ